MSLVVKTFFDQDTSTFTHVAYDSTTRKAAVIDPVLNYDPHSGRTSTTSADLVLAYIKENDLVTEWILETHIHADHLTASHYLKDHLGAQVGIGSKIRDVLAFWVPLFNTEIDTPLNASQFDCLLEDGDVFKLGTLDVRVLHTPGHTPACVSYLIEDSLFVGDTIFMPDLGTARTDFPGGSAETLYDSISKILKLPDTVKIYLCHDYPPEGRGLTWVTTVQEQKKKNVLVHDGITKEEYVKQRNARDQGKAVPKLLFPSIQVNLRAGTFGIPENNGVKYIKIPINKV